jgi:membrane-associated phospholipid phosphatase
MIRFVANLLSVLINPLMAPTFLFAILLFYFPALETSALAGSEEKLHAIWYIFIATFVFSFLLIFLLYKLKIIAKVTLENQKDRTIPQVFMLLVYLVITIFLARRLGLKDGLTLSMLASTITIAGITIINRFWKISTHASGVSGVFAIISLLYFRYQPEGFSSLYLLICLLTFGVCASRLYLKVHTPLQVVGGFILGALSGFCLFLWR